MELRKGVSFNRADPAHVKDFLRARRVTRHVIEPERLSVATDGTTLFLRFRKERFVELPLREAFLEKLLRWHALPMRLVSLLSIDTVSDMANDLLLNIRSPWVTVTEENNDALTITSNRYSDLSDLEVLDLCAPDGSGRVSRDDRFMWMHSEVRREVEPVPGDTCGFGVTVVNSETGFRSLSVDHYLIRYICSNGAVMRTQGQHLRSGVHYGKRAGELHEVLSGLIDDLDGERTRLTASLQRAARQPVNKALENTHESLRGIIGARRAKEALHDVNDGSSLYDLFNAVTAYARELELGERLTLETIAGKLLA